MRLLKCFLVCSLLLLHAEQIQSLELSWTQYSDRASLPQSLHARKELRASIDRLSTEQLSASDKMKVRNLKRLLDEVLSESFAGDVNAESATELLRLGAPATVSKYLRFDHLALLAVLLTLGAAVLGCLKPLRARMAAATAAKIAEGIVETERSQSDDNRIAQEVVVTGEVFPRYVAEALCGRIRSVMSAADGKNSTKEAKSKAPLMDTRELGTCLAQYYQIPPVEVVDKALRKERKKLRQSSQTAEKALADAREAASKVEAKAAELEHAQQKAAEAKKVADAKKGAKRTNKLPNLEDVQKSAGDAKKAAAEKVAIAEKARKALEDANVAEERPALLQAMEGAWLHAVTQTWCWSAACKLSGAPTPSHMHAWAKDEALRQSAEKAYCKTVSDKSFLS